MTSTYSLNITTVDRSPKGRPNYLAATVASLARSGLFDRNDFELTIWESGSDRLTHVDAALAELPDRAQVRVDVPTHGVSRIDNFCRALRGGAASGADYVLMLEDDIVVVRDFLGCVDAWLRRFFAPRDHCLASFYTPYDEVERIWVATGQRVGWWRYPLDGFYSAQCFALRPDIAAGLADTVERVATRSDRWADLFLKQHFDPGDHFLASVPSFAQHIGDESSIYDDAPVRRCPCFPGEDWTWEDASAA